MADRLLIEISVRDEAGRELRRLSHTLPGPLESGAAEILKAHHAEALHNYRFYGTLRAQIAWMPAVIAMAILSYAADKVNSPILWINLAPTAFLLAVFLLIFLANLSLQKDQRRALAIARVAREYWDAELRYGDIGPMTYAELRGVAEAEMKPFRMDASSKFLLLFLALLLIAQGLFVVWGACWQPGAVGCAT